MAASGAALGSTVAGSTTAAGATVATFVTEVTAVEDTFDDALEAAVTAAIQVAAILTRIGAADVVPVAVARISTRRMAFPIAVVEFAATAILIGVAAELRRVAAAVASVATAGIATSVAIIAAAADQTIHHAMLMVPAMRTPVGDHENPDDDSEPSELMHEHRELPPGRNLEHANDGQDFTRGGEAPCTSRIDQKTRQERAAEG